ncbi:MAG: PRC-barrel domain-containing protein [Armatimonadota bacterium]|nr:PRC-barrel domain-containing protein [Armatimonadota bacterium]
MDRSTSAPDDTRVFNIGNLCLVVATETESLRGCKVLTVSGRQMGEVTHLLVDAGEATSHFIRIVCCSAGEPAAGPAAKYLVLPLSEIRRIGDGMIEIDEPTSAHSGKKKERRNLQ